MACLDKFHVPQVENLQLLHRVAAIKGSNAHGVLQVGPNVVQDLCERMFWRNWTPLIPLNESESKFMIDMFERENANADWKSQYADHRSNIPSGREMYAFAESQPIKYSCPKPSSTQRLLFR